MPGTGLLDLPSEILLEIVELVAASPYPSTSSGKRYRPARLHSRAVVCLPATDPAWPSSICNLQLSCRRLYSETSEYLKKASQAFKLDVAIVNNHWIWPYWRYIPAGNIGYSISNMEINLIYCCTEDERASSNAPSPAGATEMEFLKVISHFLHHGPSTTSFERIGCPKAHSSFRVKHLTINMDTVGIRNSNQAFREENIPLRQVDGLAHLSFDPLYPVDVETCNDHFGSLAYITGHALNTLQTTLTIRERVDYITFSVDGRLRSELNIAEQMSKTEEARIADYRRRSLEPSA